MAETSNNGSGAAGPRGRRRFTRISENVIEPEIPALRRIKIGGRRAKRGKGFLPAKWDHFKVTYAEREKDGVQNFIVDQEFHELIGDPKPKELDVRLMHDEIDRNFETRLAAYRGSTRICTGNGRVAYDEELEEEIPCTCPLLKGYDGEYSGPARPVGDAACKPNGKLKVLLEAQKTFGAVAVFDTTAYSTISGILGQLEDYQQRFDGILAGLPLRMVIAPDTAKPKDLGKTVTIYKVALILRANYDEAMQIAAATRERREQLALPSPKQLERIDQEILEAEVEDEPGHAAEFYDTSTEAATEEGEEEEQDEAEKLLEDELRLTLELLEWDKQKINRQVAKYSADLSQLEEVLEEKAPKELQMAREELARVRDPEEDEEEAAEQEDNDTTADPDDDAVEAELEPNDAEEVVVEAEIEEEAAEQDEVEEAAAGAEQESLW